MTIELKDTLRATLKTLSELWNRSVDKDSYLQKSETMNCLRCNKNYSVKTKFFTLIQI